MISWANSTPIYEATSTLLVTDKFFREDFLTAEQHRTPTKAEFAYYMAVAESAALPVLVDQRLEGDLRKRFMQVAMYVPRDPIADPPPTPTDALRNNVRCEPIFNDLTIRFTFAYPAPEIAARVANLFAEEFINYQLTHRIDFLMSRVEDLKKRTNQLGEALDELSRRERTDKLEIVYAQHKRSGKMGQSNFPCFSHWFANRIEATMTWKKDGRSPRNHEILMSVALVRLYGPGIEDCPGGTGRGVKPLLQKTRLEAEWCLWGLLLESALDSGALSSLRALAALREASAFCRASALRERYLATNRWMAARLNLGGAGSIQTLVSRNRRNRALQGRG